MTQHDIDENAIIKAIQADIERVFGSNPFGSSFLGMPKVHGYSIKIGSDMIPHFKEFGNDSTANGEKILNIESILDEKTGTLRLVTDMPGVEKGDIQITHDKGIVTIKAINDRKYHGSIKLGRKVDVDGVKATYKNGILELVFEIVKEISTGTNIQIE